MSVQVVITAESQAEALVYWGVEFALARERPLRILVADEGEALDEPGDLETTFSSGLASHVQNVVRKSPELPPELALRFVRHPDLETTLIDVLYEESTGLLLIGKERTARHSDVNELSRKLFRKSPWRTLLIRPGALPDGKPKILVPAGGGPHALTALRLSGQLVARRGAVVSPLYVETNIYGEVSGDVGRQILKEFGDRAGLEFGDELVRPIVVENRDVQDAIGKTAQEGFDLVIIGQAARVSARYWLFGTFAMETTNPTLAVIHKGLPLQRRLGERARSLFAKTVPQLDRSERVNLFARLETNSRWSFDFIALLMLSTAIAGLGLALNSTAVVIGAMLVAPLMTPIIGAALGIVQGNVPLLGVASKAITFGFLTALLIGVLIGLCDQTEMNAELAGRTQGPGIMDLLVGLFSGLAAAYCTGRSGLSAALPGVAIAAALVPPIATTGICLSQGMWPEAGGAAALFGINVLTIVVGAAIALLLAGVRIRKQGIFAMLFGGMLLASLAIGAFIWFR